MISDFVICSACGIERAVYFRFKNRRKESYCEQDFTVTIQGLIDDEGSSLPITDYLFVNTPEEFNTLLKSKSTIQSWIGLLDRQYQDAVLEIRNRCARFPFLLNPDTLTASIEARYTLIHSKLSSLRESLFHSGLRSNVHPILCLDWTDDPPLLVCHWAASDDFLTAMNSLLCVTQFQTQQFTTVVAFHQNRIDDIVLRLDNSLRTSGFSGTYAGVFLLSLSSSILASSADGRVESFGKVKTHLHAVVQRLAVLAETEAFPALYSLFFDGEINWMTDLRKLIFLEIDLVRPSEFDIAHLIPLDKIFTALFQANNQFGDDLADIKRKIGFVYKSMKQKRASIDYFLWAFQHSSRASSDLLTIANDYINLARCLKSTKTTENNTEALRLYHEAKELLEGHQYRGKELAKIYYFIAGITDDSLEAMKMSTKAVVQLEQLLPGSKDLADARLRLGILYSNNEQLAEAESQIKITVELLNNENSIDLARACTQLGMLYMKICQFESAKVPLERADLILMHLPNKYDFAACRLLLGKANRGLRANRAATLHFEEARRVFQELGNDGMVEYINSILMEILQDSDS